MDELAILHGHANFAELEKLLFLQTSDKLWSSHLDQMQEDMLTASLTGMGHKASVAEYAIRSFDAYEQFRRRVIDEFIPRLMTFPVESFDMDTVDEGETISSGDVAGILV
jgi:preprotein translocase subunit SecA